MLEENQSMGMAVYIHYHSVDNLAGVVKQSRCFAWGAGVDEAMA